MAVFFHLQFIECQNGENITHKRSYCPNCNHSLGFFDLIPVLSYITLKGKCKYCNEKISPRYLILEIGSGLLFLLFTASLKIDIYNLNIQKIVYLLSGTIYISTLILMGGIDKEKHNINKSVLLFGLIMGFIYILYLYILGNNIYGYVIYLFIVFILLLIEIIFLKKKGKDVYATQILTLCIYMAMWTKEDCTVLTIILALWIIVIRGITSKPKKEIVDTNNSSNIPIGTYLCFSNIAVMIIENFLK